MAILGGLALKAIMTCVPPALVFHEVNFSSVVIASEPYSPRHTQKPHKMLHAAHLHLKALANEPPWLS